MPRKSEHFYLVSVFADTKEEADEVIRERLAHDEDYGFEYELQWEYEVASK